MKIFRGMRGNNDWVTGARPKNWRDTVLELFPNGDVPLTALLSMMSSEETDDPEFNWWTKTFDNAAGDITGIYKSADLSTGTGLSAVADGTLLYVNVPETTAKYFREGHQALVRNTSDFAEDFNAKVTQVVLNGDSSFITIKALHSSTGDPDADFDRILVIGNINPEGGVMPAAITKDPEKWHNYTQIFRTPLSITRTAMKTRLRTGDQYQRAKAEALEMHASEQEFAYLFGYPTEKMGDNGKPERTTMGLIPFIRGLSNSAFSGYPATYTDYNGTVSDYPTANSGTTWVNGGIDWMNAQLEVMFRYGGASRMAFVGNQVLLAIDKLVRATSEYKVESGENEFGMKINRWMTPFGDIDMMRHPLFNVETSLRKSAVIFEPENLVYRYITDTEFYAEEEKQNTGSGRIDGKNEEYLTEAGLEFHHPISAGFLTGFGTDG